MNNKKIILVFVIIIATFLQSFYVSADSNKLEAQDNVLSLENIKISAENQIHNIARINENNSLKNCSLGKITALFDSNDNINSYYIELISNNNKCGYVIISAEKYNNILEYSCCEESFLLQSKNELEKEYSVNKNEQKIYYLGGINYAIGYYDNNRNKKYFDVSTSNINEINKEELDKIYASNKNNSKDSPPDSEGDGFITDPNKYESGYDSSKSKNVKNWNLKYKIMSDFSDGGVCAPTAATNCMFYWYSRDNKKYKKLLNSTWKKTFNSIKTYMKTTKKDGTKDSMVTTGYTKYLSSKGFNYSIKFHEGTHDGKDLIGEIDKNRPCHLIVHNHYKYSDHSVLAVGYQQYIYEHWYGDNYETYIRIADGWTSKANRFVWGNCKGYWNYVSIQIK